LASRAERRIKDNFAVQKRLLLVCVAAALLSAAPAFAQGDGPGTNVRVRIGPLMMNPTISISNIGIDHNVFNDPPDKAPKEDFTLTVTPLTDLWLRLGPTWLSASLNESINWYQKYASERTANNLYRVGWSVPGSRVLLKVGGSYINARERPGFEIDTRAARKEVLFTGAIDFHALSKSFVGLSASRQQTRFAEEAEFLGVNLRTSLNRVDSTYAVNFRHTLTPLTSVTFSGTRSYSKFELSPDRNTASTNAAVSATFDPAALLKGSASIAYSAFKPDDPTLPPFTGMIGSVDLTYVLLGSTRFAVTGGRSVNYSYEVLQPYYVQSRIGGSVAQQIFGPFDVQVRGDISFLAYRNREGATVEVSDRSDRVTTVGVGLGFHMGKDLRLSFNVDQNNRDTRVTQHQYEKFLIGTALTYGF
jgi:hypothetical protein